MENKAADKITSAIEKDLFASVVIRGKVITIYLPTIDTYSRAARWSSKVSTNNSKVAAEIVAMQDGNSIPELRSTAVYMAADKPYRLFREWWYRRLLRKINAKELWEITKAIQPLLSAQELFMIASFHEGTSRLAGKPKL
jgi:hypothetical protein